MSATPNESMHAEHRLWASEMSQWKDDLAIWQRELIRAGEDLRKAEAAIDTHAAGLDAHARMLNREEQAVQDHEHGIALAEQGKLSRERIGEAGGHESEAARYVRLRNAHERLKRYHHVLVARISLLLKAAAEPM